MRRAAVVGESGSGTVHEDLLVAMLGCRPPGGRGRSPFVDGEASSGLLEEDGE